MKVSNMKVVANAKINLSLHVKSRREDGYHILESIMVPVEFGDELEISFCTCDTYMTCDVEGIPVDESNLVMKAYRFMQRRYQIQEQYHFHLHKVIPHQAGLGGGSSDAGAVIRYLWKEYGTDPLEEVALASVEIGADVPFCVMNQAMKVEGIGETLTPFSPKALQDYHVFLVKPQEGVSTKEAYETLDLSLCDHPDIDGIMNAIQQGWDDFVLGNSLEQSALRLVPRIQEIKNTLVELGFDHCLMSGSGSCVFGLCKSMDVIDRAMLYFRNSKEFVQKTKIICE
ncbi:MAG: 4-(cytidine 5'-diphospho)-2-C-methyl-D-erythritol kinase [Erysipelotrichales bacterium]|nr:4-(cytidine 5'-diphospho)-2-C-methyl-D-erythritol kinase [Erysipelotrichales bacterium]